MDKRRVFFYGSFFLIVFSICFVLGLEVFQTSGGTHMNPTEDVSYIFNFTINNTEEFGDIVNITQVNVTLPSGFTLNLDVSNGSSAAGNFSATSNILTWYNNSGVQGFLINGSNTSRYFWFNATAANPGLYNLTIQVLVNGSSTNMRNISITVNDTTSPNEVNFTSDTFANYSTELVMFNVSVIDLGTMSRVYFNVTNSSGDQNYTATNASNPSSYYWNASINVSMLAEGKYNVTVWSNDTYANENNTGITQFTVDRTIPVVTLTQSESGTGKHNMYIDIAITDSGSGIGQDCTVNVASEGVTFTGGSDSTQTMNQTGLNCGASYSYIITCMDLSGNSGSSLSTTYSTDACGDAGSGAGSSGVSSSTWINTYDYSDNEFSNKDSLARSFSVNNRVRLRIGGESHYVGIKSLTSSTATIEVSSTPQTVTMSVGDLKKFDVTDDGYYDISVKLNSVLNNKADITLLSIHEMVSPALAPEEETTSDVTGDNETIIEESTEKSVTWLWVVIVLVVIFIAWIIISKKRK
ncbi:MAG: hypothetical protein KKF48_04150 [Nanoarchaeota archaeon]|nr:hypothetical protein [Nanoarchaeota archaeon]MBU1028211.1 hypothetical protein [Nanoarchaeota archaeon]